MNIFCKLGWHKWKYKKNVWTNETLLKVFDDYVVSITRYCERCERIEKASHTGFYLNFMRPEFKEYTPRRCK